MKRISHEPPGYDCPFCRLQQGEFDERNHAGDVVAVTELAYARIAPKWWPGNPGGVLVIPRAHVENLYALSAPDGQAVWDLTQRVAVGIRSAYDCDGTSIRQHNEPAGIEWHGQTLASATADEVVRLIRRSPRTARHHTEVSARAPLIADQRVQRGMLRAPGSPSEHLLQ